jgi:hypothetical protein
LITSFCAAGFFGVWLRFYSERANHSRGSALCERSSWIELKRWLHHQQRFYFAVNASRTGLSDALLSRQDFLLAGESHLIVAYGTLSDPRMALIPYGGGPTGPFAAFTWITSGAHTFSIRDAAGDTLLSNQNITLNGRSRHIIAIVPTGAGGYEWMNITPC